MTLQTLANLQTQATTIVNEAVAGANTKARVGGAILDLADSMIHKTISATARILGRVSSGAGSAEELTAAQVRDMLAPPIVTDATTARTLQLSDAHAIVRCTSGSAVAVTVPPNSSVAFAIGTTILIRQAGAGQLTLVAGSGVTLNTSETLLAAKQHATVAITKVAADAWDVTGERAAA